MEALQRFFQRPVPVRLSVSRSLPASCDRFVTRSNPSRYGRTLYSRQSHDRPRPIWKNGAAGRTASSPPSPPPQGSFPSERGSCVRTHGWSAECEQAAAPEAHTLTLGQRRAAGAARKAGARIDLFPITVQVMGFQPSHALVSCFTESRLAGTGPTGSSRLSTGVPSRQPGGMLEYSYSPLLNQKARGGAVSSRSPKGEGCLPPKSL